MARVVTNTGHLPLSPCYPRVFMVDLDIYRFIYRFIYRYIQIYRDIYRYITLIYTDLSRFLKISAAPDDPESNGMVKNTGHLPLSPCYPRVFMVNLDMYRFIKIS